MKTALKPSSQSAFHRYMDTVCFCSIVCLLREQIKLNRCDAPVGIWTAITIVDTVFVFGSLFIFILSLSLFRHRKLFSFAKETNLADKGVASTWIENVKRLTKKNRRDSIKNYVIRFINLVLFDFFSSYKSLKSRSIVLFIKVNAYCWTRFTQMSCKTMPSKIIHTKWASKSGLH